MKKHIIRIVLSLSFGLFLFSSCEKESAEEEMRTPPTISFDNGTGIYEVKEGRTITLKPVVDNAIEPIYCWKIDGRIVGNDSTYNFTSTITGYHFLTFSVTARNGAAEEELRVEVLELAPPKVSLPIEDGFIRAVAGCDLRIEPVVQFGENATYRWLLEGLEVCTDPVYVFHSTELRDYNLTLYVANDDGETRTDAKIRVGEPPVLSITFDTDTLNVLLGNTCYLIPDIRYGTSATTYRWTVDGTPQPGATGATFSFTPAAVGNYTVAVTGADEENTATASVVVACAVAGGDYYRPKQPGSAASATVVFEFLPAPGQFVNENYTANTMPEAVAYAQGRLETGAYVSLGGFGGYIVVGFDHSVDNKTDGDGYDFAVRGNPFSGSSEPGIVWVMRDENGDGLPNDTWYELAGSETGKTTTVQQYAVTYFKPTQDRQNVRWTDNLGNAGTVDFNGYHTQDSYYPLWVNTDSYTLRGTALELRNTQDSGTGFWYNQDYDWGYADNFGQDLNLHLSGGYTSFKIENAINPDGSPAVLPYIDFVKVQVGVNGKSGWLGEISTEVLGVSEI
jgi:hypothetical protein